MAMSDQVTRMADNMIDFLSEVGMPEIEAYRLVSDALSRLDDDDGDQLKLPKLDES